MSNPTTPTLPVKTPPVWIRAAAARKIGRKIIHGFNEKQWFKMCGRKDDQGEYVIRRKVLEDEKIPSDRKKRLYRLEDVMRLIRE